MKTTYTTHSSILGDSKIILQKKIEHDIFCLIIQDQNLPDKVVDTEKLIKDEPSENENAFALIQNFSKEELTLFCEKLIEKIKELP